MKIEKHKYGVCTNTNDSCPKAISGEVIKIHNVHDFVCPECKTELFEVKDSQSLSRKRSVLYIALASLLILGLTWYLLRDDRVVDPSLQSEIHVAVAVDSSKRTTDSAVSVQVNSTTATTDKDSKSSDLQPSKVDPVLTWTFIDNSGFCDLALDGTYFYSERNNLGQIRERKVLNKAGCYPANN